jgi:hypothetical protein
VKGKACRSGATVQLKNATLTLDLVLTFTCYTSHTVPAINAQIMTKNTVSDAHSTFFLALLSHKSRVLVSMPPKNGLEASFAAIPSTRHLCQLFIPPASPQPGESSYTHILHTVCGPPPTPR